MLDDREVSMGRFRAALLALLAIPGLALAGCGFGENHDPYALLDKAWTVGWERVQVQVGFNLDSQAGGGDFMPIPQHIALDPSAINAIVDLKTGQWRLGLGISMDELGLNPNLLGGALPFQSIDVEAIYDGAAVYAKSPLLAQFLEPMAQSSPTPIRGDLTGWVKLGSADEFQSLAGEGSALGLFLNGGLPALGSMPLPFPLPTPGSPDSLRAFFEDLGVVTEYKGSEQRSGVDADHVAAGLDIVKLARSSRLATIFGIGPDQAQGVSEMAKQVAFSAELWFDRESGRLVGLLLNGQTLQGQITKGSLVVNLSEPTDADPFAAPTTFTDVPLKELIGNSLNNEGGGSAEATPAPDVPKPPPPQ
jgi:hypothetical protein